MSKETASFFEMFKTNVSSSQSPGGDKEMTVFDSYMTV